MRLMLLRSCFILLVIGVWNLPFCYGKTSELQGEKEANQKLPLWEAGVVGLAARLPHYRGSDEYQNYVFPLPYFVYRGDVVKASREGVRGIFWRGKRFETDISLSGNPPVSDDNTARSGMEDLDGLIEIGPALRYYFYDYGERDSFFLQANLRAAFSFDFDDGLDVVHEGNVAEISITFRDSELLSKQQSRLHLSCGIQFGDTNLHSYFYEVSPQFATPLRAQYEAKGGYGGFHLSGSIIKELTPKYWIGLYGRWMNSDGAVFEDSPLVQTGNNYVLATFFTWKIGESARLEK